MKDFKRWTSAERQASLRKTKYAIANGIIPDAHELGCNRCGQKKGIIEYHNHNYDHPTLFCESLCYRCHMALHNYHNNPPVVNEYFELMWQLKAQGYQTPYQPMYERKFPSIMREMGIFNNAGGGLLLPEKYQAWLENMSSK